MTERTPDLPFTAASHALVPIAPDAIAMPDDDCSMPDQRFLSILEVEEPVDDAEARALIRYLEQRIGDAKAWIRDRRPLHSNGLKLVEVAVGRWRAEPMSDEELEGDDVFGDGDPPAPVPAEVTE